MMEACFSLDSLSLDLGHSERKMQVEEYNLPNHHQGHHHMGGFNHDYRDSGESFLSTVDNYYQQVWPVDNNADWLDGGKGFQTLNSAPNNWHPQQGMANQQINNCNGISGQGHFSVPSTMVNNAGSQASGYLHLTPQSQGMGHPPAQMPPQQCSQPLYAQQPNNHQQQHHPHSAASSTPSRSGVPLRLETKLQFDRLKAMQDTKMEEDARNRFHQQRAHQQSNPVDLPVSTSPKVAAIPQKLLQTVETRLENPTKYHLEQRVRIAAALQTNDNNGPGGSVPQTYTSNSPHGRPPGRMAQINGIKQIAPGSAPPNIFHANPVSPLPKPGQGQLDTGVPPSPGPTISSVATSLTSGCSENFEQFTGIEGDTNDINTISLAEISDIISQDGEGLFSYTNGSLPPKFGGSRTSMDGKALAASAPLDSPETPQPGEHFRASKDRQKKDNHNKIERKRRFLINDMIAIQGQQLPKQGEPYFEKIGEIKQNKGSILSAGVDFINFLKKDNESYRQKESLIQQENRKLKLRIKELEDVCLRNGISLPQDSLTWKSPPPDRLSSLINGEVRVKEEPQTDIPNAFCELMEDDPDRNVVTGLCDPMLAPCQVDPDDIGLASAVDPQDFANIEMEFS